MSSYRREYREPIGKGSEIERKRTLGPWPLRIFMLPTATFHFLFLEFSLAFVVGEKLSILRFTGLSLLHQQISWRWEVMLWWQATGGRTFSEGRARINAASAWAWKAV